MKQKTEIESQRRFKVLQHSLKNVFYFVVLKQKNMFF